jgi:hypothetical protein
VRRGDAHRRILIVREPIQDGVDDLLAGLEEQRIALKGPGPLIPVQPEREFEEGVALRRSEAAAVGECS